jgi:hypothetical protein
VYCKNISEKKGNVGGAHSKITFWYILIVPVLKVVLLHDDVAVANNLLFYVFIYVVKTGHYSYDIFQFTGADICMMLISNDTSIMSAWNFMSLQSTKRATDIFILEEYGSGSC